MATTEYIIDYIKDAVLPLVLNCLNDDYKKDTHYRFNLIKDIYRSDEGLDLLEQLLRENNLTLFTRKLLDKDGVDCIIVRD